METVKKIGVLTDRLHVGGVQKVAIEEVRGLRKLGYQAELLVLSEKYTREPSFKKDVNDIPVIYLDKRLPRLLRLSFKFPMFHFFHFFHLSFAFLLPLVIRKKEWDLIISHNTYSSITSFVLAKLKSIPYLYAVHDPIYYILNKVYVSEENRWSAKLLLPIAKYLDKVLAIGSKGITYFGKVHQNYLEGLVNHKLVKRMPEGTVIAKQPPEKKEKKDYLITVSSWKPGKKLEDLIEITKKIADLKIKIVGSWVNSVYFKKIDQLIENENLSDRVKIINCYLSDEELSKYYRQAKALIIINPEAGFGRPIVEAAGQGTPAIAPSVCGATELFNHKEEGLFFNNLDQAISYINILMDKERAFDMGIKAWKRVEDRYSWEKHNKMLVKIINQL